MERTCLVVDQACGLRKRSVQCTPLEEAQYQARLLADNKMEQVSYDDETMLTGRGGKGNAQERSKESNKVTIYSLIVSTHAQPDFCFAVSDRLRGTHPSCLCRCGEAVLRHDMFFMTTISDTHRHSLSSSLHKVTARSLYCVNDDPPNTHRSTKRTKGPGQRRSNRAKSLKGGKRC